MRLSGLLGRHVVSESGWSYGKVFDVRVAVGPDDARIAGVVVGREGLAERLLGERTSSPGEVAHAYPVLRWEDVLRLQSATIVVRDGAIPDKSETTEESR
jgi:hypothetical protein